MDMLRWSFLIRVDIPALERWVDFLQSQADQQKIIDELTEKITTSTDALDSAVKKES